ncbi:hypothetical protein CR513_18686, partial [Mucuna pruriens]
MYQGTESVEEYLKEMEVTLIGAQIILACIVELHEYTSLSTLVHQASKVELQLKRHRKRTYPITSSNWKGKERRENKLLKRDKSHKKESAQFKGQKDEVSKVSIAITLDKYKDKFLCEIVLMEATHVLLERL